MIAKTFYLIAKTMNSEDQILGNILLDLLDVETYNLRKIFQKYDKELLLHDPLIYKRLG